MPACSAVGCTNRPGKRESGISFHRFPKESVLRAAWIVACRRKDWLPSSVSVLCSKHFSEDLIDRTSGSVIRLRENAIPNIFKDYTPDFQKIQMKPLIKSSSSVPAEDFNSDDEIQLNNGSISETSKEIATESTVCLNYPVDESGVEYMFPVLIPEKSESPEIYLASTAATISINKKVIQSSNESTSKTPTNSGVTLRKVYLNTAINESRTENMSPVLISNEFKSSGYRMAYTAATKFINNEVIELSDGSISETASEPDETKTSIGSNSPVNESIENMPPVQIPVVESDPEDYPGEDLEKIYLKRKLQESNNLVTIYRKKIKILQQQNRRWKKQLEQVKRSLNVLKQTNKALFL